MGSVIGNVEDPAAHPDGSLGAANAQAESHVPITTDLSGGTGGSSNTLKLELTTATPKSGVTKYCIKCHKDKPVEDFNKNRTTRDGKHRNCKDCQKKYTRNHYKNNKRYYISKARSREIKIRKNLRCFINNLKDKPCMDCGIKYPHYVMDFDHRDGKTKKFMLSIVVNKAYMYDEKQILEEISKCDLVCANCHRIRTWKRMMEDKRNKKEYITIQTEMYLTPS